MVSQGYTPNMCFLTLDWMSQGVQYLLRKKDKKVTFEVKDGTTDLWNRTIQDAYKTTLAHTRVTYRHTNAICGAHHLLNLVNFQEFQHLKSPVARLKRYPLSIQHFKPPQHTNTTNKRRQNTICPSSPCWHSHAQQSVLKQCICCCIQHEAQVMPAALGLQVTSYKHLSLI